MFNFLKGILQKEKKPPTECGQTYPHHSDQPHYHVGHPRKKRQSMTKGKGHFDGDEVFINSSSN